MLLSYCAQVWLGRTVNSVVGSGGGSVASTRMMIMFTDGEFSEINSFFWIASSSSLAQAKKNILPFVIHIFFSWIQ